MSTLLFIVLSLFPFFFNLSVYAQINQDKIISNQADQLEYEPYSDLTLSDWKKIYHGKILVLQLLFKPQKSPYPGLLTNNIRCIGDWPKIINTESKIFFENKIYIFPISKNGKISGCQEADNGLAAVYGVTTKKGFNYNVLRIKNNAIEKHILEAHKRIYEKLSIF